MTISLDNISLNNIGLIFIFIGAIIEALADIFFKIWNDKGDIYLIIIGTVLYLIGTGFWVISLRYESFTKSGTIFLLLNVILLSLIGSFLFKDNISLINRIGIAIGIVSIIMIDA